MSLVDLQRENAELKEQLARKDAELLKISADRDELRERIEQLTRDAASLKQQLDRLLRQRFGPKGEKWDEGQLGLFWDDAPADEIPEGANEAPDAELPDDPEPKKARKSKPRIDHAKYEALPRREVIHELPEEERVCQTTGLPLVPCGVKVFEEVEYSPAQLEIVVHRRIRYGLSPEDREERKAPEVVAPLPPRPIENAIAGPGLLAQVLTAKYADHLPLHRQERIFARAGLSISRKTLCEWVMRSAELLTPIVDAIAASIRSGRVILNDDTGVLCSENAKGAGRRKAYIWSWVSEGEDEVVFDFSLSRAHTVPDEWLGNWLGHLMCDGLSIYETLATKRAGGITLLGCWGHARRYFFEARTESEDDAHFFLAGIRRMYAIERKAKDDKLDEDAIRALRQEKTAPILARLHAKALELLDGRHDKGGLMHRALNYMIEQWPTLERFAEHGHLPIDNLACERSFKGVAVGRRNWLFTASPRGGHVAATVYSLVESCKLADVNFFEYVRDVLVRICTHPASKVDDLRPKRWKALRAEQALAPLAV